MGVTGPQVPPFQQGFEVALVLGNTLQLKAMVTLKDLHNMTAFPKKKKKRRERKEKSTLCEIRNLITSKTIN